MTYLDKKKQLYIQSHINKANNHLDTIVMIVAKQFQNSDQIKEKGSQRERVKKGNRSRLKMSDKM